MKKYTTTISLFLLACQGILAQNWNVFNKNYRYNYTFDNSALVSNVLFVTSTVQAGMDTVYKMNLIATPCQSGCPTITANINGNVSAVPNNQIIIPFQPQFLQRTIKKLSNGSVVFSDTANFLILPDCILNQTWSFDNVANKNATCVALGTKTIFSVNDSVKTIIIGSADTLLLSKSFGIIQFPQPYAQNKYYRLVGIENASSYNVSASYGSKVPNFWDVYNYNVGDQFYQVDDHVANNGMYGECYDVGYTRMFQITGKASSANGYTYQVQGLSKKYNTTSTGNCAQTPVTNSAMSQITYSNSNLNLENILYPGALVSYVGGSPSSNSLTVCTTSVSLNSFFFSFNLTRYMTDINNNFTKQAGLYKYAGSASQLMTDTFSILYAVMVNNRNYLIPYGNANGGIASYICTSGVGNVMAVNGVFEIWNSFYTRSVVKGGDTLYGPMPEYDVFTGIETYGSEQGEVSFYPNPAAQKLKFNLKQDSEVEVYDNTGKKVKRESIKENDEMTISDLPPGLYLVKMKTVKQAFTEKLIISR